MTDHDDTLRKGQDQYLIPKWDSVEKSTDLVFDHLKAPQLRPSVREPRVVLIELPSVLRSRFEVLNIAHPNSLAPEDLARIERQGSTRKDDERELRLVLLQRSVQNELRFNSRQLDVLDEGTRAGRAYAAGEVARLRQERHERFRRLSRHFGEKQGASRISRTAKFDSLKQAQRPERDVM